MKLLIDAFNIRSGGGLTHLREILNQCNPTRYSVEKIFVCGIKETLATLNDSDWLEKIPILELDLPGGARLLWQQTQLKRIANRCGSDLIFSPGGIIPLRTDIPVVTMFRNLQPFDPITIQMYKGEKLLKQIKMKFRYLLIRKFQELSFKRAKGIIFLTKHGKDVVLRKVGGVPGRTTVIPHGISPIFFFRPREPKPLLFYSDDRPYRFIYVSTISVYKHQWHVARAVAELRNEGIPIAIDFIGPAIAGLDRLESEIKKSGAHSQYIRYLGPIPYGQLKLHYQRADGFVFASTCETFGQVLIEAMASGLPVASSHYDPMREILGETAVFFNPSDPQDIKRAMRRLMMDQDLSQKLSTDGFNKAKKYSWEHCSNLTFQFISDVFKSPKANLK